MRESAKVESTKTTKRSDSTVRHNLDKSKEASSCGSCGVCSRLSSPQMSSKSASSALSYAKALGKESCAVSFMQRNYGNSFTASVLSPAIQKKCSCGGSCSRCKGEEDAERISMSIMKMPSPLISYKPSAISYQPSADDEQTQISEIMSSKDSGQRLDNNTRSFMEDRFGYDFSHVRVHTDSYAARKSNELNAEAFTIGRDVFFNAGRYSPSSSEGKRLLAHELTHVVQQQVGIQRKAIHRGNILDEGSCEHLACNSKYACKDNVNGITCPKGTRNASDTEKYRPLFTCDNKCENNKTCSDSDKWMAIPKSRFTSQQKCGQDLVICANGKFTHAYVRDKSEIEAWEVSRGIQDKLGVSPYAKFTGSIFGDENDAEFKKDTYCHSK